MEICVEQPATGLATLHNFVTSKFHGEGYSGQFKFSVIVRKGNSISLSNGLPVDCVKRIIHFNRMLYSIAVPITFTITLYDCQHIASCRLKDCRLQFKILYENVGKVGSVSINSDFYRRIGGGDFYRKTILHQKHQTTHCIK